MKSISIILFFPLLVISQGNKVISSMSQGGGGLNSGNPIEYSVEPTVLKAFTTAEGDGAGATGGRGGKNIFVTSTDTGSSGVYVPSCDCYEGTFKWALEQSFPAFIWFRVSGVWAYPSEFSLYYDGNDDISDKTIVGSSAPRPGVFIYGTRFQFAEGSANNIIMRGINILYGNGGVGGVQTALNFRDAEDVILSDITAGWSYDQIVDILGTDMTKQRILHIENDPGHNTGGIIGDNSSTVDSDISHRGRLVTSTKNVFSHVGHRFENFAGEDQGRINIINNVAYNFRSRLSRGNCDPRLNHIGNYYKKGPNTPADITTRLNKYSFSQEGGVCSQAPKIYTRSNIVTGYHEDEFADNSVLWQVFLASGVYAQNDPLPSSFFTNIMHDRGVYPPYILRPFEAYQHLVLKKNVGARYYTDEQGYPQKHFEPFIESYIDDVINYDNSARLANSSLFVMPTLTVATVAYTDTDKDGMPDTFEDDHGFDKNDYSDAVSAAKLDWQFDGFTYKKPAGKEAREVFADWIHGDFNYDMLNYID